MKNFNETRKKQIYYNKNYYSDQKSMNIDEEKLNTSYVVVKDIKNLLANKKSLNNQSLQLSLSFYNLNEIMTEDSTFIQQKNKKFYIKDRKESVSLIKFGSLTIFNYNRNSKNP